MADSNPTGPGATVALTMQSHHVSFLKGVLETCKRGVEGDLASAGSHPNRERAEREAAAYGHLLRSLDSRAIVPDVNVIEVVERLAESVDTENDYDRAVREHRALCGLLGQLQEGWRR